MHFHNSGFPLECSSQHTVRVPALEQPVVLRIFIRFRCAGIQMLTLPTNGPHLSFHLLAAAAVVYVDGVRVCLRTAGTNRPIVHPPHVEYG
jgi:hypothetical protein